MIYEYDYETIFNEKQIESIEMGLTEDMNVEKIIKTKMNAKAKDGWEVMLPMQLPTMWFRRENTDV